MNNKLFYFTLAGYFFRREGNIYRSSSNAFKIIYRNTGNGMSSSSQDIGNGRNFVHVKKDNSARVCRRPLRTLFRFSRCVSFRRDAHRPTSRVALGLALSPSTPPPLPRGRSEHLLILTTSSSLRYSHTKSNRQTFALSTDIRSIVVARTVQSPASLYTVPSLALHDAFPQRIEISVLREKSDVVDPAWWEKDMRE